MRRARLLTLALLALAPACHAGAGAAIDAAADVASGAVFDALAPDEVAFRLEAAQSVSAPQLVRPTLPPGHATDDVDVALQARAPALISAPDARHAA